MKLAIYGVSRAGKDYLIKNIIDYLHKNTKLNAIHIEGSKTLNDLSQDLFLSPFKHLNEQDKNTLREKFTEIVNKKNTEYDLVLVDGHYSFIVGDSYNVVFTEQDENVYDHFFYLDTPSEMIVEFSRKSEGEKRNLEISEDQIHKWKYFEKKQLGKVCSSLEKELVILDEDTKSSVLFVKYWLDSYQSTLCNKNAANRFYIEHEKVLKGAKNIVLVDCDKTVSINDVTYDFCEILGVNKEELKAVFRNDRYTSYQFFKVWNLYKSKSYIDIENAAQQGMYKANISNNVYDYLKEQKNTVIIGITSGVFDIWNLIDKEYRVFDVLVGNVCIEKIDYLVTPLFKRSIAKKLRDKGKNVIAIGDSIIDIPMLETANQGYLVAHEKLNKVVELYISEQDVLNIGQLFDAGVSYNLNKCCEI